MKAAVVEKFKEPVVIRDWDDPECGPDDAIVKVMANGLCRTDWHLWQGHWDWLGFSPPLPAVLGHEMSGVVEEVGSNVANFEKGDRIVVPFMHACGRCGSCADGFQNRCDNGAVNMFTTGGTLAEATKVVNADVNLVHLPEGISFVDGAALGCRFMTAYRGIVAQARAGAGQWVAVFGCGGVGLAAVDIANALGCNVIAISRTQRKLDMAKKLGAVHTVVAGSPEETVQKVKDLTGGGAHVSADCLGTSATFTPSLLSLRKGGRLVRLGLTGSEDKGQISLAADAIVALELEIYGSMGMQARCYPEMLRMIESGKLHPEKLVSKTFTLEQLNDELTAMSDFQQVGVSVLSMT